MRLLTRVFSDIAESFKKGRCQLEAKICAGTTGKPLVKLALGKVWLDKKPSRHDHSCWLWDVKQQQKIAIFKALFGSHSQSKNGFYLPNFVYLSTYLPNFHEMFPKFEGKSSFLKFQIKNLFTFCLQKVLSKFEQEWKFHPTILKTEIDWPNW